MRRLVVAVAVAIAVAGCSSGYNAGVTHVGRARLLSEWKQWLLHRSRRLLEDVQAVMGRTGPYYVGASSIDAAVSSGRQGARGPQRASPAVSTRPGRSMHVSR